MLYITIILGTIMISQYAASQTIDDGTLDSNYCQEQYNILLNILEHIDKQRDTLLQIEQHLKSIDDSTSYIKWKEMWR